MQPAVSGPPEAEVAAMLLRLLLEGSAPATLDRGWWDAILRVAVGNAVLIRTVDRLRALGYPLPAPALEIAGTQRDRADDMIGAMARVADLCQTHRIPFCFPKALQHLPDTGQDIDLLVGGQGREIDRLVVRDLGAVPLPGGFRAAIAGSSQYRLPECAALLDIQHGRLGLVGENTAFPASLLDQGQERVIGGYRFQVPTADDRVILHGMQRVYGRTGIRITDILSIVTLVRSNSVNWDHVITKSREHGTLPGLSCWLSYVDRIYTEAIGRALPWPAPVRSLVRPTWGRPRFQGGLYRFRIVSVNVRLYLERAASDLWGRRWASAGRLLLLPAVAAAAVGARATGRRS
jgi:hypothetical protein